MRLNIIKHSPRNQAEAWTNYSVCATDDLKRANIANLADTEGDAAIKAIFFIILAIVMTLTTMSTDNPVFLNYQIPWSDIDFVLFCAALLQLLVFAASHARRVKLILSLDKPSLMQIRTLLGFQADADVFMIHNSGIHFTK